MSAFSEQFRSTKYTRKETGVAREAFVEWKVRFIEGAGRGGRFPAGASDALVLRRMPEKGLAIPYVFIRGYVEAARTLNLCARLLNRLRFPRLFFTGDQMRRTMKDLLIVVVTGVLLLFQGSMAFARSDVKFFPDTFLTGFPSCRIDDQMRKISIVGDGPGSGQILSILTRLFLTKTEIKVVDPANLRSALAGKVIEYRTGIDPGEAQALSQMLQIDHLIMFDIETAPHKVYRLGGRNYAVMSLKIVNTLNGEILFHGSRDFGVRFDDPRKYGYTHINEQDSRDLVSVAFLSLLHELRYALGDVDLGMMFKPGTDPVVGQVFVGSVGERAGIKKDDTIVDINGLKVSNQQDIAGALHKIGIKQGDEITIKIERDGKPLDRRARFPVVPFRAMKKPERPAGEELPEEEPTIVPQSRSGREASLQGATPERDRLLVIASRCVSSSLTIPVSSKME
jgi:hypothetical protein